MKNYLNKSFVFGILIISLGFDDLKAQPIQLVPHTQELSSSLDPLPLTQPAKGFWEGSPSSLIEAYFAKLPLSIHSPTLRDLRDQLLKDKYEPLLQNTTYQQTLFSQLKENGQFEQAKEFLNETNLTDKQEKLLDLQWLTGEQKKTCEKITNLIRTSPTPEWKKQNIYCLYLNGEEERGKVATELFLESHPTDSLLIRALFDPSSPPSFEESIGKSPFLLTVWCATGTEIPEDMLKNLPISSLSLIAQSDKMPLSTRIVAGQLALQAGVLKGSSILNLLNDSTSEELLEKFAHELKIPQSESLLPLFERVSEEHKLGIVGDVFKPLLSKITPSQEMLPLAPYMVRAFLESGEKDLAQKWGVFMMREAPEEAIPLLPLLHLAFPQNKWGENQLQAWQTYQNRSHPETAPQNSYELRRILEALGEPIGVAMKGEPSTPSWRAEKTLFDEKTLDLLNAAALSHRKGEVLLFTLIVMGDTPLKEMPVDKLVRILGILHKAGFTNEARSLALEYLLSKFS